MKLCIITCYNQPDYVRAKTLRAAAGAINGVDVLVIKNTRTNILRYAEVFLKLLKVRLRDRPDAYLLTFRGYEMLLPVRVLTLGKPLIYDEFINPIEWAVYEHGKLARNNPLVWAFKVLYRWLLKTVNLTLTDTESHAELSAEMLHLPIDDFLSIPVGTDEVTFKVVEPEDTEGEYFTVFYYGNMLPLHGLQYVIDAAVKLNHEPVKFMLVGGSAKTAHEVAHAVGNGAKIEYKAWVEFESLPAMMRAADLCLAGPFGGTFQSQFVVTGKAYQYMALGRPIVIGRNKESHQFKDKRNALIVPQADADALAETIRWAMRNRNRLASIGRGGQALYRQQFSAEMLEGRLALGLRRLGLLEATSRAEEK